MWPQGSGPRVACYLNLIDKRYDWVWQALRRHGARVVVVSPGGLGWACAAAAGWGIQIERTAVMVGEWVRTCDAFIGHGGMGMTSLALQKGKRTLLLPTQLEQTVLAHRLHQQHLATSLVRIRNRDHVRERVTDWLIGPQSQQALALAARYADYQTHLATQRVADCIGESMAHWDQ
jgi:UDP:flavonoid glycosyltransferase YjiC (YdhE family)